MGELANMTGQPVEYKIGDTIYRLMPLTIGDFAALEADIRRRRIEEYRRACDGLDPVILATGIEHIIKDVSDTSSDTSIASTVFLLYRSMTKNHPDITPEKIGEIITLSNLQDITAIVKALAGETKNPDRAKAGD